MRFFSQKPFRSLPPIAFEAPSLVIITGVNGAGKSQFLQGIMKGEIQVEDEGEHLKWVLGFQNILGHPFQMKLTTEAVEHDAAGTFGHLQRRLKLDPEKIEEENQKSPQLPAVLARVAELAEKPEAELQLDDFRTHLLAVRTELAATHSPFQFSPAALVHSYNQRRMMNEWNEFLATKKGQKRSYLTDFEFVERYGPPPLSLMEEIAKLAGLGLHCGELGVDNELHFRFVTPGGATVESRELSSGEQLLLGLSAALYNSGSEVPFPEVVLFDEVDSALHPEWVRRFLDGLERIFVERANAKVILVTHSPTVVALAPENSLFVMSREDRHPRRVSKDRALGALTAGVPSLRIQHRNRCQVFVESKFDEELYSAAYQHILHEVNREVSLAFVAVGHEVAGGCDRVISIVRQLRAAGNEQIFGLVDRDVRKGPTPSAVFSAGGDERYSIENYFADPLLIAALLVDLDPARFSTDLGLASMADVINMNAECAAHAVRTVTQAVPAERWPSDLNSEAVRIHYIGGISVECPRRWLDIGRHQLLPLIRASFPALERLATTQPDKNADSGICRRVANAVLRAAPQLTPASLVNTFRAIQAAASSSDGYD